MNSYTKTLNYTKEKTFVNRHDCKSSNHESGFGFLLFVIITILTFGFIIWYYYDEIFLKHYMKNRRKLIKLLEEGSVELISTRTVLKEIAAYQVKIDNEFYEIWIWKEGVVSLASDEERDFIGLFLGSWSAKRLNKKLREAIESSLGMVNPDYFNENDYE